MDSVCIIILKLDNDFFKIIKINRKIIIIKKKNFYTI